MVLMGIGSIKAEENESDFLSDIEDVVLSDLFHSPFRSIVELDHYISLPSNSKSSLRRAKALRQLCYYQAQHYNYNVDSLYNYAHHMKKNDKLRIASEQIVFTAYVDAERYKEALVIGKNYEKHTKSQSTTFYYSMSEIYVHLNKPKEAIEYQWKAYAENERLYPIYNSLKLDDAKRIVALFRDNNLDTTDYRYRVCDSIVCSQKETDDSPISPNLMDHWIWGYAKEDTLLYLLAGANYSQYAQIEIEKGVLHKSILDKSNYAATWKRSNPISLARHIANEYITMNYPDSALKYICIAEQLAQKTFQDDPNEYISILLELTNIQMQTGKFSQAEATLAEIRRSIQQYWGINDNNIIDYQCHRNFEYDLNGIFGIKHSTISNYLLVSARLYVTNGDIEKYQVYQDLLNGSAACIGTTLPQYLGYWGNYYNLNTCTYAYYKSNLYQNVYNTLRQTLIDCQNLYNQNLSSTYRTALGWNTAYSSSEREQFMKDLEIVGDNIFIYAAHTQDPKLIELAYDYALYHKQLLLRTDRQLYSSSSDTAKVLLRDRRRLLRKRTQLTGLARDSVQKDINSIERQLTSLHAEDSIAPFISMRQIAKRLSQTEVAIEFIKYEDFKDWQPTGHTYYAALLIRANDTIPTYIPLCEEKQLQAESVWLNILPYLYGIQTVYFSPDGMLHNLAIETASLSDKEWISDRYHLIRLTSTKVLVTWNNTADVLASNKAMLLGDINYGAIDGRTLLAHSTSATRSFRNMLDPLVYSKREIEYIQGILSEHGVDAELLTQDTGTKEHVESFSGHSPEILHFSTHGFSFSNEEALEIPYYKKRGDVYIDPMERCGLYLNGAAYALCGDPRTSPENDGVLTALEISALDYNNTKLVVLSACNTALGDVSSEGVWGLQRAFKLSGAQTIVMALWPVDDEATSIFMKYFYEALFAETIVNPHDALTTAQRRMREYPRYSQPHYWAGFIVVD